MITSEYFNVLKHTQNHAPNLPQPPALPAAPSVAASAARHSWQRWLCGGLGQAAASSHSDSRATSCPRFYKTTFGFDSTADVQRRVPSRLFRGPGKPTRLAGPTGSSSRGQVSSFVSAIDSTHSSHHQFNADGHTRGGRDPYRFLDLKPQTWF